MLNAARFLVIAASLFVAGLLDAGASISKTRVGNFLTPAPVLTAPESSQVLDTPLENWTLYDGTASGRPFGFIDGPNLYTYVRQNPWTTFDPLGLYMPSNQGVPGQSAWGSKELQDRLGPEGRAQLTAAYVDVSVTTVGLAAGGGFLKEGAKEVIERITGVPVDLKDIPKALKGGADKLKNLLKGGDTKSGGKVGDAVTHAPEGTPTQSASQAKAQADAEVETVAPGSLVSRQGPSEMTGNKVKRLTKDMKENGFDPSHPIEVADVNGRNIIIDGHHRAEAAKKAGVPQVPIKKTEVTPQKAEELGQEAAGAAAERESRRR